MFSHGVYNIDRVVPNIEAIIVFDLIIFVCLLFYLFFFFVYNK